MAVTYETHQQAESQTGPEYVTVVHATSGAKGLGGINLVDDGTDLVMASTSNPVPVTISGVATAANQSTGNTALSAIQTAVEGTLTVDGSGVTQPVSAASMPLPSGAATSANQSAAATLTGAVTETAPASDTASSGLNGRLQRIAQRITTLMGKSGTTDSYLATAAGATESVSLGYVFNGATWSRARGDSTNGALVNLGSNNDVTVTGTVTVDGSGVTQPVSGTVTANLSATDNAVLDNIDSALLGGLTKPVVDSYTSAAINVAAGATDSVLVAAPGASKQIWVYGITFTTDVAGTVSIQDSDDTAITGVVNYGANGGVARNPAGNLAMPLWKVATNKALEMDTVTCEVDGDITYAIVSV